MDEGEQGGEVHSWGLLGGGREQQRRQPQVLGLHTQEGRCVEQRGVTWCKVKPKEGRTPGR